MSSILVIDDDPALSRSLEIHMQLAGHRSRTAIDAATGLKLARRLEPDILFLDINLPDESGLAILPRLTEELPRSTIIIMTAEADNRSAIEAMRLGASDYLRKPLDLKTVLEVIKLFERQRLYGQNDVEE